MSRFLVALLGALLIQAARCDVSADVPLSSVPMTESDFEIRDPFVLVARGLYYMYESKPWKGGEGVWVRASHDLKSWTPRKLVMRVPDGVDHTAVWAPEVHRFKGRYYLFTTLTEKKGARPIATVAPTVGDKFLEPRGTWAFVADDPEGPFAPVKTGPVTDPALMTLDGTLLVEDGRPSFVYCHEWCQMDNGTVEYAPLTADLGSLAAAPKTLLDARSAMKGAHNVTDGPFFWRSEKSAALYMIWSNTIDGHGYCVLVRSSPSGKIAGPWTKDRILFGENGGHGMIFKDLKGRLQLTLHQPNESPDERMKLFELVDDGQTLRLKK